MVRLTRRQLVKAGALGTAASAMMPTSASAFDFRISYSNWAGNVSFKPDFVKIPQTLDNLQSIVSKAGKVRAVGTRHSFNSSMATEDTFIMTDGLNKILAIDTEKKQIKAEAGLKLHQLNTLLDELGWSLPSLGDIAEQSLAGLICTGTHGTGLEWGSFSDEDSVIALEIVTEDGSLIEFSEQTSTEEEVQAARLSLGALGIIYSVTLQCVPAHNLELTSTIVELDDAFNPRHYLDNDHYEFFHFPFTNKAQKIIRNITAKEPDISPVETWFNDVILENIVLGALISLQSLNASEIKKMMEFIISLAQDEQHVGKSYEMMASQRLVKFYETEYCFPIEQAQEVFAIVESVANHYAESDIFYANFPSEVRFIRGDQGNLLTPTLGRDSVFFAVQSHPAYGPNHLDYFKAVEQEFIKIGGLPHWGKMFFENALIRHPNAEVFEKIRKHYDPNGKFLNPFLQKLVNGEAVG